MMVLYVYIYRLTYLSPDRGSWRN